MANRKSRSDEDGERPESETSLPPGEKAPPPLDEGPDSTPPEGFVAPEDSLLPASMADRPRADESRTFAGEPIPPEDMPPLDAETVGPEPDPAAGASPEPDSPPPTQGDDTTGAGDAAETGAFSAPPSSGDENAPVAPPPYTPRADEPVPEPSRRSEEDARLDSAARDQGDEGGRSMAATLLLALLLILGGAALGIWAAPKIAPLLPAGMAPVADWLSPSDGAMETRLGAVETETAAATEALRAELAALREEVEAVPEEDPAAELEARLADLEERLGGRVEDLAGQVAALDVGAIRERVSQLDASIGGIEETQASLREQLAAAEAAGDDSAEIDTYRAEVDGLRGQMQDIAGQVGQLSNRIDEVAAQAARQVEFARGEVTRIETEAAEELSRAETATALAQIRSSLEAGTPFEEAVAQLASRPEGSVPEALSNAAPEGVSTVRELRDTFPAAATAAIRASIQARSAEGGVIERLRSFAESQVASRSLEPRAGVDTDSVLSRMEAALGGGDIDTALTEAEALPPAAAAAMDDWLASATARQQAVESFEALQAELSATN